MTVHTARPGNALSVAMLLLAVLSSVAVAALTWATSEVRVADDQRAQTSAFVLAEAGLERYFARGRVTPADTTMVLPGGKARVRAILLRAPRTPADTPIYVIRSDGITAGSAAVPEGRRTVAQLAKFLPGRIRVRAAWSSLSGVIKTGGSGSISGVDLCTGDSLAGLAVPTGTYTQVSIGADESPISGKPRIDERGTQAQMAAESDIDWGRISDPLAPSLTPDIVVCYPGTPGYDVRWPRCGSWPPSSAWNNPDYWPTILVNGSAALPQDGRGTLIVTGDLTFGGGDDWEGIVLIGNRLLDNGNGNITGAIFTGLNVLTGQVVTQSSKSNGPRNYDYDSCDVQRAAAAHSRLAPIPNAWVDNWTAW